MTRSLVMTPQELSQTSLQQDRQRDRETNQPVKFLSDLSSLELLLVKQLAVYRLAAILRGHFTLEQLNAFIQVHKPADLISKIFGMVKMKKKVDHACFGQPLYVAVERTGVDSARGSSLGTLRIPRVMEEGIGFLEKNGDRALTPRVSLLIIGITIFFSFSDSFWCERAFQEGWVREQGANPSGQVFQTYGRKL